MLDIVDRSNGKNKGLTVLLVSIILAIILFLLPRLGSVLFVNIGVIELNRAFHQPSIGFATKYGDLTVPTQKSQPVALDRARTWFEVARSWDSENARAYYALGRLFILERDSAAAKSMLIAGSHLAPPDRSVYFLLGNLSASQGRHDEAIEQWRIARSAVFFFRRAVSLWQQIPEAEAQYRIAIEVEPDNYKIFQSLGYFYWNSGRPEMAMVALQKAYELAPSDPYTKHLLKGEVLHLQGKYLEALKEFLNAIRLRSSDPQPFYRAGDSYVALGQPENALVMFKKALSLAPTETWLLTRIENVEGVAK